MVCEGIIQLLGVLIINRGLDMAAKPEYIGNKQGTLPVPRNARQLSALLATGLQY
jgi:hypothetical protein